MKDFFINEWNNFKQNYKVFLLKILIYFLGLFFFGLGIALYLNTKVGASQIDITIFAFLAIMVGINTSGNNSGSIPHNVLATKYSLYLMFFYIFMFFLAITLRFIDATIKFRQKKNKAIFIRAFIISLTDLIPLIIWPYFVSLNLLYLNNDVVPAIGDTGLLAQIWIFIGAFLIYCFGIALTVFANILSGPYNALAIEFQGLTKLNFSAVRIIADLFLGLIGIIALLVSNFSWNLKLDFLTNYLGFGTIFFICFSGPIIHSIIKILKRIIKFKESINSD